MDCEHADCLLSLPAACASDFCPWNPASAAFFVCSDPPDRQLGSGGGTAHLLAAALRTNGAGASLETWLGVRRKLIIHGSGQSRRLPAYATEGKPLLPLPTFTGMTGQAADQRLIDLQLDTYQRILRHAPASYRVMVTCGDVLLTHNTLIPAYPEVDVLIVGIHSSPEECSRHGVLICPDDDSERLSYFLQKPSAACIRDLASKQRYYLDTGVWLLSMRAVMAIFSACGWSPDKRMFVGGLPQRYELFDTFALALGDQPTAPNPALHALRTAVLPLNQGRFYHFGTNRSIITSTAQLAAPAEDRRSYDHAAAEASTFVMHASVTTPLGHDARLIWIENACISAGWHLRQRHVLTGIPVNDWQIDLPAGACVDLLEIKKTDGFCLRIYGFDDAFRGPVSHAETRWMGRNVITWLQNRNLTLTAAGLAADIDLQAAALFPVVNNTADLPALLQWMVADAPATNDRLATLWLNSPRLSADDLLHRADTTARARRRNSAVAAQFSHLTSEDWRRVCRQHDLETVARIIETNHIALPAAKIITDLPDLSDVHDAMLRTRLSQTPDDKPAFAHLRTLMVEHLHVTPVMPRRNVLDEQIIWGRAPARLDFAGGWTDTPPYCLEHGGRVVNMAVNLNGQPPVQAFARVCEKPHLVIRSIDLGIEETIRTTAELMTHERLGSGFSIARAAFRLAGFDPQFNIEHGALPLPRLLERNFGGGIELSMLAAIPKGSGLGTSSILAATILGTLGEICGLHWSQHDLFLRTLVLEQLLTSGGGWQDQVGGIVGGLKLVETTPGLLQKPVVRWLPAQMIHRAIAECRFLLYYTGLTRVAHNILGEIVRGIFLNDATRLTIIRDIGHTAELATEAIQKQSWGDFCEAIRRSWRLNQALDQGTNPPTVQAILNRITRWVAGAKLLGAGGGGYLVILTATQEDGHQIRHVLETDPPNARARFVDVCISETGLEITRS